MKWDTNKLDDGRLLKRTVSRKHSSTTRASLTATDILTKQVVDQKAKAALEDGSKQNCGNAHAASLVSMDAIILEPIHKATGRSFDNDATPHSISPLKAIQQSSRGSSTTNSANNVRHEELWCADVAKGAFEAEAPPSGSAEGSSSRSFSLGAKTRETDDDDGCSDISHLSELSGGFSSASTANRQQERQDVINKVNAENQVLKKHESKESSVDFDQLTIREYERIPGDNPSCSSGPSLAIGWAYTQHGGIKINDYESRCNRRRRQEEELILSREQREKILQRFGYTDQEIAESVRLVNKARAQRKQTDNFRRIAESVEFARRKVKSLLSLSRRHR